MKNVQDSSKVVIERERLDKRRKAAGQEPIPYQKPEDSRQTWRQALAEIYVRLC